MVTKFNTLDQLFNHHLGHIIFDKEFVDKISYFKMRWLTKKDFYTEFLGSNLLGVHPIRFSVEDFDELYKNVLIIDHLEVRKDLHALDSINPEFNVESSEFNQMLVWLMSMTLRSKLSSKYKDILFDDLYFILTFKLFGSIYFNYFDYDVDPSVARIVFERLSGQFDLKKYGSWGAIFKKNANHLKTGKHLKRLLNYSDDDAKRTVIGIQNALRSLIKTGYNILKEVDGGKEKLTSTSLLGNDEEGIVLKDIKSNGVVKYNNYIDSIIGIPTEFVVDDYAHLVSAFVKNVDKYKLKDTLIYLSNEYENISIPSISNFQHKIIESSFEYLTSREIVNNYNKNIVDIIILLKGYFSSSSSKNPDIPKIKKAIAKVAHKATGNRTKFICNNLAICVLIYIVIRSIAYKRD